MSSPPEVEPVRIGEIELTGRSAIAVEFSRLPPDLRRTLGVPDAVVAVADAIVAVARLLLDDVDPRPWNERLADLGTLFQAFEEGRGQHFADGLTRLSNDEEFVTRLKRENYRVFVRRLLGAARYDRLEAALRADAAVLVIAIRRMVRNLMPLAVALDDCAAFLTPQQIAQVEGLDKIGNSLLHITLLVDESLENIIEFDLPLRTVPAREDEAHALDLDVEKLADRLRPILEGRTRDALVSLSEKLARKVQGARDVLEYSADGVSQAANSLVELIDRLLRKAFPPEFVVEWVRRELPAMKGLIYSRGDESLPTKRAQALCFAYAGRSIDQPIVFNDLAAMGLVEARGRLEKIKHADSGDPEEIEELKRLMSAVEGFIGYTISVGWVVAADDELEDLRLRLRS